MPDYDVEMVELRWYKARVSAFDNAAAERFVRERAAGGRIAPDEVSTVEVRVHQVGTLTEQVRRMLADRHRGEVVPGSGEPIEPRRYSDPPVRQCVYESWRCDHCHDDPPPGHVCPNCGTRGTGAPVQPSAGGDHH